MLKYTGQKLHLLLVSIVKYECSREKPHKCYIYQVKTCKLMKNLQVYYIYQNSYLYFAMVSHTYVTSVGHKQHKLMLNCSGYSHRYIYTYNNTCKLYDHSGEKPYKCNVLDQFLQMATSVNILLMSLRLRHNYSCDKWKNTIYRLQFLFTHVHWCFDSLERLQWQLQNINTMVKSHTNITHWSKVMFIIAKYKCRFNS